MGKPIVYIDGREGTTGLQIYDRLAAREDVRLLLIEEEKRKDPAERARLMNQADIVFLCLPDAAAVEAVELVTNPGTRIIDCSTAHRVAPGWVYGFPELHGQRERIAGAKRVANPGCYATGFLAMARPLAADLPRPLRLYRRGEKGHRPVRRPGPGHRAGEPPALRRYPGPQAPA